MLSKPIVIGISGAAGCGKDTVADIIMEMLPQYAKYSFAKHMKDFLLDWVGSYTEGHMYGRELKEVVLPAILNCAELPYYLRKHFGSQLTAQESVVVANTMQEKLAPYASVNINKIEAGYAREDIFYTVSPRQMLQWVGTECVRDVVGDNFWVEQAPTSAVVIPDVRFENEADFCRLNGVMVHVSRPNQEVIAESGHISESGIMPDPIVDKYITNDSTIDTLRNSVDQLLVDLTEDGWEVY